MQGRRMPIGTSARRGSCKVGMINAGVPYSTHQRNVIKHLSSSSIPSTNGYVRMYLARKGEYDHWKSTVADFAQHYQTPEEMLDTYRLVLCSEPGTDGVDQVVRDVQTRMFRLEFLLFSFLHSYYSVCNKESGGGFAYMRRVFLKLEIKIKRLSSEVRTIETTLDETVRGYDVLFGRDRKNLVWRFHLLMPQWIDQRLAMIRHTRQQSRRNLEKTSRREEEVKARKVEKEMHRTMKEELQVRLDGVTRNLKESRNEQEKVRFEEILHESKRNEERRFKELEDQLKASEIELQEEFERRLKAQDEEIDGTLQRRLKMTETKLRREHIREAGMKETALRDELDANLRLLEEELGRKLEEEVNTVRSRLRMDYDRHFASLGNQILEEFKAKSQREEQELDEEYREVVGSWEEHARRELMDEQAGIEKNMYAELEQSVLLELEWRQEFGELAEMEIRESLSASIDQTYSEIRPDGENSPIRHSSFLERWEGLETERNRGHESLRTLQNRLRQKKEAVSRWEKKIIAKRASMSSFLCPCCGATPRDVLVIRCRHLVCCSRCFNEYLPGNCPHCKWPILKGFHCKLGN